jgi:uncharacterized protein (DUF983 family)
MNERPNPDATHAAASASHAGDDARPLLPALARGWRRRCPNCGGGPLFDGYLKVRHSCVACGEAFHHHRADDAPAWVTILVVGHILLFSLLTVETAFHPPLWVHWALWPAVTLGLTLWFLPRIKGMIVALQWARHMHGFGDGD